MKRFGAVLYRAIAQIVPRENAELNGAVHAHAKSRDGYALLDFLAFMSIPYMHKVNIGWGPDWQHEVVGPLDYVTLLENRATNEQRSDRHNFTEVEVATEFIHRGIAHPLYNAVALTMQTKLAQHRERNPDAGIPPPQLTLRMMAARMMQSETGSGM